jgi:hypothetical protein
MTSQMKLDVYDMFGQMAATGQAPPEGCSLFGVGYEDAFERLRVEYMERAFKRGATAQKFVVGPFGAGKTHFLRHLQEIARRESCVVCEIPLTKQVDFTRSLIRYQEVATRVQAPTSHRRGMRALLEACLTNVRAKVTIGGSVADAATRGWVEALAREDLTLPSYARVASRTLLALLDGDDETADAGVAWLEGTVADTTIAKRLGVSKVLSARADLHGQQALHSLFQLVRAAGFRGTLVCFDEAEQGLTVDRKRHERVMQILQADSNAFDLLTGAGALVVYAITPDVERHMMDFAALQQRISDPGPGFGFFDGFTLAPVIDLTKHRDVSRDLISIGRQLAGVYWEGIAPSTSGPPAEAQRHLDDMAREVAENDPTAGSRREMVKRTCAWLVMHGPRRQDCSGGIVSSPSPRLETPAEREAEV